MFLFCESFVAYAKVRDYSLFSIDIPENWNVEKHGETYVFTEPKRQCVINISMAHHQGASYNELGILLFQNLHGKSPKADDDGFTFMLDTKSDILSTARLTYQGDNFALVVASGSCANFQEILNTLTMKNKGPRAYPILANEQTK